MARVILMTAALFLSVNASAFPCERLEAQFIGTVAEVVEGVDSCTVLVGEVSHYAPSMLCPLDDQEFENIGVLVPHKDGACRYAVGDKISGVAVLENDVIVLD